MSDTYEPRHCPARPFEGYPAYGAVHDVLPNDQLRNFLYRFSVIADKVFQGTSSSDDLVIDNRLPIEVEDDLSRGKEPIGEIAYDPRPYYRIFDVESLGVSVVEMDPSAKHARAVRTVWEKQDFGAVEQEARNEMGRRLPNARPHLFFNRVQGAGRRLPGVPKTEVRQKLALLPDPAKFSETISLVNGEADIIIAAIKRRLKQFMYPWDIFPHMTFSVFRSAAGPEKIDKIINNTNKYLEQYPFGVRLGDIDFRYKTERRKRY